MAQLNLFCAPPNEDENNTTSSHWNVFIDGASRNNPGKAGAGIYMIKDGEVVLKKGIYLGIKTNNQAEYFAALLGLFYVKQQARSNDTIRLISDSLLVVKQLTGEYKVKHPDLKPLHALAQSLVIELNVQVQHVLRTENTHADAMANTGVDKKVIVPPPFALFLKQHEINI